MPAWNLQLLLANFYRVASQEVMPDRRLEILMLVGSAFCTGEADRENPVRVEPLRRLGTGHLHWHFDASDFPEGFEDNDTLAGLERHFFLIKAWGRTCGLRPASYGLSAFPLVPVPPLEGYHVPSVYFYEHHSWQPVSDIWLSHFFARKNGTLGSGLISVRPVMKNNFEAGSPELLLVAVSEMAWANQIGAFHQTIALGTWILERGQFWNAASAAMRRFGSDIWGLLGVALAHCWASPDAVYTCLSRMEAFTRLPSQQRDLGLADLQIVCRWGLASPSRQLFLSLVNDPLFPRMSTDFHWCLRHYFEFEFRNLEDKLLRFVRESRFHSHCKVEGSARCQVLSYVLTREWETEMKALQVYLDQLEKPVGREGDLLLRMLRCALNALEVVRKMWQNSQPLEGFDQNIWAKHDLVDLFHQEDELSCYDYSHLPRNLATLDCFDAIAAMQENVFYHDIVEDCVYMVRVANKRTYSVEAGDVLVTAFLILAPFENFQERCRQFLDQALEHYVRATHGKHHRIGLLASVRNAFDGVHHNPQQADDVFAFRHHPNWPSQLSEEGKRKFVDCVFENGAPPAARGLSDEAFARADQRLIRLLRQLEERLPSLERYGRESISYEQIHAPEPDIS
jgi:hypothetical protein